LKEALAGRDADKWREAIVNEIMNILNGMLGRKYLCAKC